MSKPVRPAFVVMYSVVAVICFIGTVRSWADHTENPEPLRISLADYIRTRPANKWLQLTDCSIFYSRGVVYKQRFGGSLTEICLPVYPDGTAAGPVPFIVRLDQLRGNSPVGHPDEIHATITGMIGTGLDDKLQAVANWKSASQVVVLNENKTPAIGWAVGSFAVGLISLISCICELRRMRQNSAQPSQPDSAPTPSFPDPAVTLEQYRKLREQDDLPSSVKAALSATSRPA